MITTFTENDLIQYIYGESSESEKIEIKNALVCDADLEEKFFDLKLDTSLLDRIFFDPSDLTLESVFNFSSRFTLDQKIT